MGTVQRCMRRALEFVGDERGQDVVEYTLILAAIVVLSAVLFGFNQEAVTGIWNKGTGYLNLANDKVS